MAAAQKPKPKPKANELDAEIRRLYHTKAAATEVPGVRAATLVGVDLVAVAVEQDRLAVDLHREDAAASDLADLGHGDPGHRDLNHAASGAHSGSRIAHASSVDSRVSSSVSSKPNSNRLWNW